MMLYHVQVPDIIRIIGHVHNEQNGVINEIYN